MAVIEELVEMFERALVSVDRTEARNALEKAVEGLESVEILDSIMTPALERIGEKWETGDVALSQVYMSGIICEELVDEFVPQIEFSKNGYPPIGIATFEDHHSLGKRIVLSMMKAGGFTVTDYGLGVNADRLSEMVKNDGIKVLLISTLMFPSALHVESLREKLDGVKIIVGGAPFRFDPELWEKVGADAMGRTASEACSLTLKMSFSIQILMKEIYIILL